MQHLAQLPVEKALSYGLYAGHLPWGLHTVIPAPCHYISMVRDPVDRLVSHYFHVHGEPEHHSYKQIVEGGMSLLDFVTSDITIEVENLQSRYFAGLEAHDVPLGAFTGEMFDRAVRNIEESFVAVGAQEYFDQSLLLFQEMLGWKFDPFYTPRRVNASRPRNREVAPEVREAIMMRNGFDLKLHAWVTERVRAAIQERGEAFEDHLRAFRKKLAEWQAARSV
jgi:hypothetical protein